MHSDASTRVVRAACPHDCPDTCAMKITVENGRAVAIQGDPDHPTTRGFLCAKVSRYLERTYHPDRLLYPQRRVGKKGEGRFERISWEDAIGEVAARFQQIIDTHGPQAILPYSYSGTLGLIQNSSLDRRFFNALGASQLERTICSTAGSKGFRYTVGAGIGTDPEAFVDARLILLWGTNTLTSNPHLWPFIKEARRKGAVVVAIDPWRSRTAEQCDQHIAPLPGTDAALALGMMHVIFRDGLHDQDYLERYCLGGEELKGRAAEYPLDRVSEICGLPGAVIESLAQQYARTQPAAIRLNYGLQRHFGGGMAVRTIACLPAVTGAWRHHAGGALLSTSGNYPFNMAALERPDLIPPGTRSINMCRLGEALLEASDPPVKALYVYNSNPAAVTPDQQKVLQGLQREDLFTVVHEHFLTDTARYADLLLPATTQLEHTDIHKGYGHMYVVWNSPAIEPVGESLSNTELFRRLAAALGMNNPLHFEGDEALAAQALQTSHPNLKGITVEALKAEGWKRLEVPRPFAPFAQGNFPTPSGKCELYSAQAARDGFDPLPTFTPPAESRESSPELFSRYPLTLLSPPAHHFLNSSFVNVLHRYEGGPTVELNPKEAEARGLLPDSVVEVLNDRGGFLARLVVTEKVREGVAVAPSIWWNGLMGDGRNVNNTTSQRLTDMGMGATFYDNLVEVRTLQT